MLPNPATLRCRMQEPPSMTDKPHTNKLYAVYPFTFFHEVRTLDCQTFLAIPFPLSFFATNLMGAKSLYCSS